MTEPTVNRILITTSTLPASDGDPVPAFVRDQVIAFKALHPGLDIHVLAPHNAYTKTASLTEHPAFTEHRFHYLWPFRLELLAGRGIAPALRAHKWLYLAVPFLFLGELLATYRLARRLKPDVLYVHWFTPQGLTAAPVAKRLGLPLVFTTHASDVAILKKIPLAGRLVQRVCRQAQAYTAVSEQTAERLRYFWPAAELSALESKLHIIPMGTDVGELAEGTDAAVSRLVGDKRVVLFVGRLVRRKGVSDLITAFGQLAAAHPDTLLVIAGDGQDKAAFEAEAARLQLPDRIHFPGYVSGATKAAWLAAADIVCLPSVNEGAHAEGLPVVFMEGLSAGKIIVASDVTGAQEYVTNSVNGYVFAEHDVDRLASALASALALDENQGAALRAAGRQLAANFAWPKVAAEHYTVLQDAVRSYHRTKA